VPSLRAVADLDGAGVGDACAPPSEEGIRILTGQSAVAGVYRGCTLSRAIAAVRGNTTACGGRRSLGHRRRPGGAEGGPGDQRPPHYQLPYLPVFFSLRSISTYQLAFLPSPHLRCVSGRVRLSRKF